VQFPEVVTVMLVDTGPSSEAAKFTDEGETEVAVHVEVYKAIFPAFATIVNRNMQTMVSL